MDRPEATAGASGPLGLGAVAQVLTAPAAAFRAVAADPQWVGPTLVCFALAMIAGWMSLTVSLEFGADMAVAMMDRMGAPEEAIEEALAEMPAPDDRSPKVLAQHLLGQMVSPFFGILLGALVIHAGSKLMGGTAGFRASVTTVAVAMVVGMIGVLAKATLMGATGTVEVSFGPPALLGLDYHSLAAIFLDLLDPFLIWYLIVLGIGASVVHGISRGAGFGVALVWWVLGLVPVVGMRIFMAWSLGSL